MPRAIQKLTRHGNAIGVNIPRQMLVHLGWLGGQGIVVEMLENDAILLRRPDERDFAPLRAPRVVRDDVELTAK